MLGASHAFLFTGNVCVPSMATSNIPGPTLISRASKQYLPYASHVDHNHPTFESHVGGKQPASASHVGPNHPASRGHAGGK